MSLTNQWSNVSLWFFVKTDVYFWCWLSPTWLQCLAGLPFGLFWNCVPEIKWFGHFWKVTKKYILCMFWTNLSKIQAFYEILNFNLIKYFEGNLAFIWPFFIFQDLAFLKLLMAKFGLFNFFGPGNPDAWLLFCCTPTLDQSEKF